MFYLISIGFSGGANGAFIIYWSPHTGSTPALMGGTWDEDILFSRDADSNHVITNNKAYGIVIYTILG